MNIAKLFNRGRYDEEEYRALLWKIPDGLEVIIKKTDSGYFAKLENFKSDNVITEAETGQELVEMVNEALFDYLNIPSIYRNDIGYFLPPASVREEIKIEIPERYLNKNIGLVKA